MISNNGWFNLAIIVFISLILQLNILPILKPIIKNFDVQDNYLNQIRINQELNNIKLAKEIRDKKKKPNSNVYSESVKMHLGIEIKKEKSWWQKLFCPEKS